MMPARFQLVFVAFVLPLCPSMIAGAAVGFTFNGFSNASLILDGMATVTQAGLLRLNNDTKFGKGHAFFGFPLLFGVSSGGMPFSFSTTFIFAIVPQFTDQVGSHGMAFVVSPTKDLIPRGSPGQYLGLFTEDNDGNASNRILAVEFDVTKNTQLGDIDDNHVGIDVNTVRSTSSSTAGYFPSRSRVFENLTLASGDPMQAWVEFDRRAMQLNVTVSPLRTPKPELPLLSSTLNLSEVFQASMYVGFSSATGKALTSYYVLGWSFQVNGSAEALDLTRLPPLPPRNTDRGNNKRSSLVIWLPIAGSTVAVIVAVAVTFAVIRKTKLPEMLEDWEIGLRPHRIPYKELLIATRGFAVLLGEGAFGKVYRGVLPTSDIPVAVKRISHHSRQGMRGFKEEIRSMARLRHRNLVQLLGYCRHKGEFLLVFDLMPNGSLDKLLFSQGGETTLDWKRRLKIITDVASGLQYLHEGCQQAVIHRDIKSSNVLLDGHYNGRLGDFGLARLSNHGEALQTTDAAGTRGYAAPEIYSVGRATKATDMYAFGIFLLEVACGRKPIIKLDGPQQPEEHILLVNWVREKWREGHLVEAIDPRLEVDEDAVELEEIILVLKLGLHCSNTLPKDRPSIGLVVQILDNPKLLSTLSEDSLNTTSPEQPQSPQCDDAQRSGAVGSASATVLYEGR